MNEEKNEIEEKKVNEEKKEMNEEKSETCEWDDLHRFWYQERYDENSRLIKSCGCSECDEVYEGKGQRQKLIAHARKKHGVEIEIDGYTVWEKPIKGDDRKLNYGWKSTEKDKQLVQALHEKLGLEVGYSTSWKPYIERDLFGVRIRCLSYLGYSERVFLIAKVEYIRNQVLGKEQPSELLKFLKDNKVDLEALKI